MTLFDLKGKVAVVTGGNADRARHGEGPGRRGATSGGGQAMPTRAPRVKSSRVSESVRRHLGGREPDEPSVET